MGKPHMKIDLNKDYSSFGYSNINTVVQELKQELIEKEKRIGELEKSLTTLINYGTPDSVGRWNYEAALVEANKLLTK